jgi:DNA-directed RNA polymerase specialized sigma24 family protein
MTTGAAYPDWDAVYRDNVDRVYRMMVVKVGNRPDAEDLTAEVFLTALRPLARYWRRTLGLEVTTLDDEHAAAVPDAPTPSDAPHRAAAILDALPDTYRRILQLRFLDSCTVSEAAAAMGVSPGNAKVLQHRALRRAAELARAGREGVG